MTLCLLVLTHSPGVIAQQSTDLAPQPTPNQEQTRLYQRAVEAYQAQDYTTTIALLETANRIQPFNLFSYNIARAYIKLDQCEEAHAAYKDAQVQPSLGPPLTRDIERGLEELELLCPGTFIMTCARPEVTQVSVDGGIATSCMVASTTTSKLKPGSHVVVARIEDQVETYPFDITGMKTTRLEVTLEPKLKPKPFASKKLGLRLGAAGAGLLVSGIVIDTTLVRSRARDFREGSAESVPYDELTARRQSLRRSQALTLSLIGLGAVGVGLGSTLWLRAHFDDESAYTSLSLVF